MYRIFCPPGQQKVAAVERWPLVIVYAKTTWPFFEPLYHVWFTELFDFFACLLLLFFLSIYLFVSWAHSCGCFANPFSSQWNKEQSWLFLFAKTWAKKGKGEFGWKPYFTQTLFPWWASLKRLLLSNFSSTLFQSFESVSCQRQTEWSKRAETELLDRSYKYSREWILRREWYRQRIIKNFHKPMTFYCWHLSYKWFKRTSCGL